jgi:hypothetical protein
MVEANGVSEDIIWMLTIIVFVGFPVWAMLYLDDDNAES